MAAAQAGDRRIKEIELLMMLAQIAEKRDQHDQAAAVPGAGDHESQDRPRPARAGRCRRGRRRASTAPEARSDEASRHAVAAVTATETTGNRFMLPVRLGVLADIYGAQGRLADADRSMTRPQISSKASWSTCRAAKPRPAHRRDERSVHGAFPLGGRHNWVHRSRRTRSSNGREDERLRTSCASCPEATVRPRPQAIEFGQSPGSRLALDESEQADGAKAGAQ